MILYPWRWDATASMSPPTVTPMLRRTDRTHGFIWSFRGDQALHFVGVRMRVEVGYRRVPGVETKSEKTTARFLA
jgi:hypothetical protein